MESKNEETISDIITTGFMTSMEKAQALGMSAGEFKTVALQTLMGNFIAAVELGTEGVPQHIRMENFKKEIAEFESAGLTIFMGLMKAENPGLSSVPSQRKN